ncbi:alpha/beta fold hydrolase [Schlesneria paludicola]|uniref:alpha/beta fold hydrolase n=1 Tax=Schlesneria paludicola TaxID=360056 RepID=UPI00029AF996|nr:alpha/beta hydrolase [Schlesneria paludicola]
MNHLNPMSPVSDPTSPVTSPEGLVHVCEDNAPACSEAGDVALPSDDRIDGAGEPCPTPMMWQDVREQYLRDSTPWEIVRGPHRLAGRTWGDGPPLYFVNNFAATAELYSLVIWLLRDHFRCVVFDAVTSDTHAARLSKPTICEFAEDLMLVADRHGDVCFPIYGAGFGAAVALQAAVDHPARIQWLVLQHGFAKRKVTLFERMLASACLRSGQLLDQLPQRRRFQAVNHKPWFPPFDSSRFDFLIQSTGTLPLRDLARRAIAVRSFDLVSRLGEVSCPVMLLRTEGEGRMSADSQTLLEQRLKDPRVEWMHSAGQHPCLTHPHRVAKIVQTFQQSVAG